MHSPSRMPPKFVPTLTEVVSPQHGEATTTRPTSRVDALGAAGAAALPRDIEEDVVHRIMQRVDMVLDQRLREAIVLVIQEQTRSIVPRLREEVETVVRHSVCEAMAEELANGLSMP